MNCIRELPEIQRFAETYAGSNAVAVLTINTLDPTRDHVRRWMEARGYDFPVLWGGDYALEVGVAPFPTTWVVDREGRIAFKAVGPDTRFTEKLEWWIAALMNP